jgi:hypothetical protein
MLSSYQRKNKKSATGYHRIWWRWALLARRFARPPIQNKTAAIAAVLLLWWRWRESNFAHSRGHSPEVIVQLRPYHHSYHLCRLPHSFNDPPKPLGELFCRIAAGMLRGYVIAMSDLILRPWPLLRTRWARARHNWERAGAILCRDLSGVRSNRTARHERRSAWPRRASVESALRIAMSGGYCSIVRIAIDNDPPGEGQIAFYLKSR